MTMDIKSVCKALRCMDSISPGSCRYQDQHEDVICDSLVLSKNFRPCPYYQEEYGVDFEAGECDWLSDLADYIQKMSEGEK